MTKFDSIGIPVVPAATTKLPLTRLSGTAETWGLALSLVPYVSGDDISLRDRLEFLYLVQDRINADIRSLELSRAINPALKPVGDDTPLWGVFDGCDIIEVFTSETAAQEWIDQQGARGKITDNWVVMDPPE